jgi:hypothetical protein
MKISLVPLKIIALSVLSLQLSAQSIKTNTQPVQNYYIDVHHLQPGKVKFSDVEGAHTKDLATQDKFGAKFIKYWVNEEKGLVYCLASASGPECLTKTHAAAHGLMPDHIYQVTAGEDAALTGQKNFFLDIHDIGPGKVDAAAAAGAHKKDLECQKKHGVNFVNYWVDEKEGIVICLSQAKDSTSIRNAHKEAHGLLPDKIIKIIQGE